MRLKALGENGLADPQKAAMLLWLINWATVENQTDCVTPSALVVLAKANTDMDLDSDFMHSLKV